MRLSSRSDARLLHDDFGAFYDRHLPTVRGYVRRHVFQPDLVLDLVAETFARALENRAQYRAQLGPARAWLLGIARNLIIDSARRGQVEAASRIRLGMQPLELDEHHLASSVDAREVDLEAALAELPVEQREAVLRRIVLDESYDAMALDLACSEQVVRKRVSRGLTTLRTYLGDHR